MLQQVYGECKQGSKIIYSRVTGIDSQIISPFFFADQRKDTTSKVCFPNFLNIGRAEI